jgi:DNA polymerase-3 subunit delta
MSIKHFIVETGKGLVSPAYFLYAEDAYLLKEAGLMAGELVPQAERDFSFDIFDMDGIDEIPPLEQIIDVINTIPFMGKRRVVVLENVQELTKKEMPPLVNYLENPSPYSLLILLHKGNPKTHWKELMRKVKAIPLDIRPQEIPLWIREKVRQKGLDITHDAIEYLMGVLGPDVGLLSSEVEKLALIGKRHVDAQDIKSIVRGSGDYDVFDLVNALRDKDTDRVFRVARVLQATQESYGLLGAINWHYSRMAAREQGRRSYYAMVFALLNEADIRIKTSGGTFPLEYLLIRLLQV